MSRFSIVTKRVGFIALLSAGGAAQAETTAPAPPSDVSKQGGTLSEKLNATNGVIHPEGAVDPGMQKQPPATGTMPVVRPPGSPGGSPDVTPK